MQNYRGQNFRGGYRKMIEMIILEEVAVGLETGNIQIISEEMTEVVVVGLDQVQE